MRLGLLLIVSLSLLGQRSSLTAGFFMENPEDVGQELFVNGSGGTQQMISYALVPASSKTLVSVTLCIAATVGSISAGSARVDVEADSGGNPSGVSLASGTATPSAGYVTISVSYAVTINTRYHLVLTNTNSSPSSNYFRVCVGATNSTMDVATNRTDGDILARWGWRISQSQNGGSTWVGGKAYSGFFVTYSDDSIDGIPNQRGSGFAGYGTLAHGVQFTSPSTTPMRIKALGFKMTTNGTLIGNLRYRIYVGTVLQATATIPNQTFPDPSAGYLWAVANLGTTLAIPTSSDVRIVFDSDSASDTGPTGFLSNSWNIYTGSASLTPFGGTSYISLTGSTWSSPDATKFFPFVVILDATPFNAIGTSAGISGNAGIQ